MSRSLSAARMPPSVSPPAWKCCAGGGSAVDAVVAGIKPSKPIPTIIVSAFRGLPNLLGEVELDASIMDGQGLRPAAVGALQEHQDAIAWHAGSWTSAPCADRRSRRRPVRGTNVASEPIC